MVLTKVNASYFKVQGEAGQLRELQEELTFEVENIEFMKRKNPKLKYWDGTIKLFNLRKKMLYAGHLELFKTFCKERDYAYTIDDYDLPGVDKTEVMRFLKDFTFPAHLNKEQLAYQIKAFSRCVMDGRRTILSPTGSGKSYIIYLLTQWYRGLKILITVPTVGLVEQMKNDLLSYGVSEDEIYCISAGIDKVPGSGITISTWQSIYKEGADFFNVFEVAIGDEVHLYEAKSLSSIFEQLVSAEYRFRTDCYA